MRLHSATKILFILITAAFLVFLGCAGVSKGTSPRQATPAQNATISASASPTTITQGDATTLAWTTTNATGVTIDNGVGAEPANGNVSVKPTQTTTYHLVANASGGVNATADVIVNVNIPIPPGPPPAAPTVSISANPATIAPGNPTTLAVTATDATGVTITNNQDSNKFTLPGAGGTQQVSPSQTTTYTATATGAGGTQTASTTVTVNAPPPPPSGNVQVTTWHMDNARSGANLNETVLTPANIKSGSFGKLFSVLVQGYVYAEPLYMSGLNINGSTHNVVFVATEEDWVYAFDADNYNNNTALWKTSLLASGQQPLLPGPIKPWIGITATPVIDPNNGTMYVVTATTAGHFLHALDILTGAERPGSPMAIQASVHSTAPDATNGMISLARYDLNRASLLLSQGRVYVAFGSSVRGWILGYDENTLQQKAVLCITPNKINAAFTLPDKTGDPYAGTGGIWGGGGGPAADGNGNIYVITADGPFDGQNSWSESVLKLDRDLNVTDSFTPFDYQYQNCKDDDMGSATTTLLSDSTGAYLLTGEKNGKLYLLNRSALGGLQNNDAGAAQTLWYTPSSVSSGSCPDESGQVHTGQGDDHEIYGGFATFQQWVYVAAAGGPMKQWSLSGGKLVDTGNASAMYNSHSNGAAPFVSANGSQNGILWALDNQGGAIQSAGTPQPVVLRAYDATDVSNELYDSAQAAGDAGPLGIKFTSPVVANGKVYVVGAHDSLDGTSGQLARGELDVYGLLK